MLFQQLSELGMREVKTCPWLHRKCTSVGLQRASSQVDKWRLQAMQRERLPHTDQHCYEDSRDGSCITTVVLMPCCSASSSESRANEAM